MFEDYDIINQDHLDMVFFLYLYKRISLEQNGLSTDTLGKAPWAILNQIISTAGLPYLFTSPSEEPIKAIFKNPLNRNSTYNFSIELVNLENEKIGINNLSSGERVILSLAMLLYYFQHRSVKKNLLLLDEIDAHLHPSLTKQFFNVVNENIIKEYGTKVIMATHSASTVALSPPNSLFIIEKTNVTSIRSVSKDVAINLLTSGVPSLSIDYENRRQIFVESKYDAEYYDLLYTSLKVKLPEGASLNFISSGLNGRGNSDQVSKIVQDLNNFGNKSIFGIIDWDKKNQSTRSIRVLGDGKRYSIESYIFDPVLMAYFLYREKILSNVDLNLEKDFRIFDFRDLNSIQIQALADKVLEKLKPKFSDKTNNDFKEVSYFNRMIIKMPDWFLTNYGHDLPKFYMEIFPSLGKFRDENGLRRAVITNTISDLPEFISSDLVELFEYFHTVTILSE